MAFSARDIEEISRHFAALTAKSRRNVFRYANVYRSGNSMQKNGSAMIKYRMDVVWPP